MGEVIIATCLWDHHEGSFPTSRCYDEKWVERLYLGFARNMTRRFCFVLFTDRDRRFEIPEIRQEQLLSAQGEKPCYGCFNEPYRLDRAMILVGLDTVITGNCDQFSDYCLTSNTIALCHDPSPKRRHRSINGVQFIPSGWRHVYDEWVEDGAQANDMVWLWRYPWNCINRHWPGLVHSFKCDNVRGRGLSAERIVYFHGTPKPHELLGTGWIRQHWLGE